MNKKVTITITNRCNLNCTYCYEAYKTNDSMSSETAKAIILKEFSKISEDDTLLIDFMGGEPFLNFELIKEVVEFFENSEYSNRISYFVSTNGTLVKGIVKDWLISHKHLITCGLSLDGDRDSQNRNRSNSFNDIDIELFQKTWPEASIKMTVSPYSLKNLAHDVKFLHSFGFKIMNNFAFGVNWFKDEFCDILKNQLEELVIYYLDNPSIVPCQMLNLDIGRLAYRDKVNKVASCGAGTLMTVYDVFANNYPCHFFQPLSIGEKKSELSKLIEFNNISNLIDKKCETCNIYSICKTCYGSNFNATGDPRKRDLSLCSFTKLSAYYTAVLCLEKIKKYGIENLGWDEIKQTEICNGIEDIYSNL